jgi:collagen type VII alpha
MECFVYNWRILLGGAASAAILTVGIAAPALAQSVSRADSPTSLSGTTQVLGGSSASGVLCDLPGIPMAGPEASAAAGVAGAPCDSAGTTQQTMPMATTNGPAGNLSSTSSSLPGLNSVSGSIPDLGSAAGLVSGTSTPQTSSLPQVGSVTGASQGTTANNVGSSSSSLVPGSSSDSSGATGTTGSTGTTGTTGLGSVTGAVNNLTGSLPGGNSLTTNTAGQGN